MPELHEWDVAAANNNSAAPDGFPENMPYGDVNNAAREVMAVLRRHWQDTSGVLVSGGSADAQTLTPTGTYSAYADGLTFTFEAGFTNTGTATLNVSGIGAASLRKLDVSTATFVVLAAGDLTAGQIYTVVYDSANSRFVLVNPSGLTDTRLRLSSTTAVSLVSTAHPLQIGADDAAANLAFDRAGIQARDNGAAAALEVQRSGGNLIVGPSSGQRLVVLPDGVQSDNAGTAAPLYLNETQAAGSHVRVGPDASNQLEIQTNAIDALNNGAAASLDLNPSGGSIVASGNIDLATGSTSLLGAANAVFDGSTRIRDRPASTLTSGAAPTAANRGGVLYFTASGGTPYSFTVDTDANLGAPYAAELGQTIRLVNNSGAALTIAAAGGSTLVGAASLPDGDTAELTHVAVDTWAVFLGS